MVVRRQLRTMLPAIGAELDRRKRLNGESTSSLRLRSSPKVTSAGPWRWRR